MTIIKNTDNTKSGQRSGETGILIHCWWECQKVQPPWKIVWQFLKKLNIETASSTRGQAAEARSTTILQLVEGKPHSQKDRQNEKAEDFVPDEGTR